MDRQRLKADGMQRHGCLCMHKAHLAGDAPGGRAQHASGPRGQGQCRHAGLLRVRQRQRRHQPAGPPHRAGGPEVAPSVPIRELLDEVHRVGAFPSVWQSPQQCNLCCATLPLIPLGPRSCDLKRLPSQQSLHLSLQPQVDVVPMHASFPLPAMSTLVPAHAYPSDKCGNNDAQSRSRFNLVPMHASHPVPSMSSPRC
jgi:hypothetical protein